MSDEIEAFFETYERNSTAGDIDRVILQFADSFLTADPSGARTVQASDLKAALPKRKQLFQAMGCKATRLMSLDETPLGDHYMMVRTSWRWEFDRPDRPEITLQSTFIVRKSDATLINTSRPDTLVLAAACLRMHSEATHEFHRA